MEKANKIEEILDFKELSKVCKNFSLATNVDVTIYEEDGAEIAFYGDEEGLCRKFHCEHGQDALDDAVKKSNELSSTYIFETPCGLVKCVFPITHEGVMFGYVACGPVMLWEDDEFARSEFEVNIAKMLLSGKADISKVKQYDCERMTSIAELLFVVVSQLVESQKKFITQRYEIKQLAKEKENIINQTTVAKMNFAKYPAEIERELITCVQLGQRNRAKAIINKFLGEIFAYAGGQLDMIKMKLYEFIAFLSRSAVENGASISKVKTIVSKASEITNEKTDFNDVCFATVNILDGFFDLVEEAIQQKNKTTNHLEKAIDVINESYSTNPSLEKIAAEIAISPYYLSHLFKQQLSTTYVEYLTGIKIQNATTLLKSGKSIEQVSEEVGYNDSNYFSKIFKKRVGVTPSQYKKKQS